MTPSPSSETVGLPEYWLPEGEGQAAIAGPLNDLRGVVRPDTTYEGELPARGEEDVTAYTLRLDDGTYIWNLDLDRPESPDSKREFHLRQVGWEPGQPSSMPSPYAVEVSDSTMSDGARRRPNQDEQTWLLGTLERFQTEVVPYAQAMFPPKPKSRVVKALEWLGL